MRRLGQLALVLGAVLAGALLVGLLSVVSVGSSSMAPTVCVGDRLLLWSFGARSLAGRGDVVTLREPAGARVLLKRVVAVAGQTVELVDGHLVVDGRLQDESYVDLESVDGTFFGPVTVGSGSVFVLGDRREHSIDSRDFGDVPRSAVTGVVLRQLTSRCPG